MNKIINGVASEYDMPMKYENKSATIFIDTQDMEERYAEQLYQEYLEKENRELKSVLDEVREIVSKSVFKTDLVELCRMKNQIKEILDKVGGSNE